MGLSQVNETNHVISYTVLGVADVVEAIQKSIDSVAIQSKKRKNLNNVYKYVCLPPHRHNYPGKQSENLISYVVSHRA